MLSGHQCILLIAVNGDPLLLRFSNRELYSLKRISAKIDDQEVLVSAEFFNHSALVMYANVVKKETFNLKTDASFGFDRQRKHADLSRSVTSKT